MRFRHAERDEYITEGRNNTVNAIDRRTFSRQCLQSLGATGVLAALRPASALCADGGIRPLLGKVKPRPGKAIAASPLGIGFETLDRKLFLPERTYERLADLGVKWARVQTGWCRCETQKGRYDFAWLDAIVDALRGIGVLPWFNLGYGNQLYTPEAPNAFAVGWAPTRTAEARQAWVRFVRALAEHFRGRVQHWEIWNEVNISSFWKPDKSSPAGYMDLVKLTAPEIRARIPGATLIGGALAGGLSKATTEYLRGCLELGLAEQVDRISYHPYALIPELNYASGVGEWRAMLARYKPSLALWQAECGCPSTEHGVGALSKYPWNESRQARWLVRRVLNDLRLNLEHISWYNVADQFGYSRAFGKGEMTPAAKTTDFGAGSKSSANTDAHFGLLRAPDYTPKPAYFAYQTLCALFDSQTEAVEMPLRFAGDFVGSEQAISADKIEQAAFVRAQCPLAAYWFPADVHKDMATRAVDMTFTVPAGMALREPVLVDPLSGEIFKLEGKPAGRQWQFRALPLTDHPMLVTDRSVVLDSRESSRKGA